MTNKIYILTISTVRIILFCISFLHGFVLHAETNTPKVQVDMYGHNFEFDAVHIDVSDLLCGEIIPDKIGLAVQEAIRKLPELVAKMDAYVIQYQMDDFAFLLMVKKYVNKQFVDISDNEKSIIIYSLLKVRKLDVLITYNENAITLYGRTNYWIDNVLYVQIENKTYFDLSFSQLKSASAQQLYLDSNHSKSLPLVINTITPPAFHAKQKKVVIPFEYDGFTYFFTAKTNLSLVEYYKELPTLDINTLYLNYGFSDLLKNSLVKEMKKAVSGMKQEMAIDFLLKFTQQAFAYRSDEELYGQEKFSFPEETILNRYSDCEDKAILFATLGTQVLGLNTVALYYKDAKHINIAIQNNGILPNSSFVFDNKNYIICDPTINGYILGDNLSGSHMAKIIEW